MMMVGSAVGDVILEVLLACSNPAHRAALEAAADERGISYEQLIAAAVAGRLSEMFVIRWKLMRAELATRIRGAGAEVKHVFRREPRNLAKLATA